MSAGRIFCSLVCLAIASIVSVPAFAEAVGAAAAVRPASKGTPPGGSARTLQVGTGIEARERIETSGSGSLQVMFLDKSTLTIGPNSDLVIDEFVYNSNASTGQFAASLTKGALRFVGGQISHTAGATINTPAATVGIRGGAALVSHDSICHAANTAQHRGTMECTKVVCMSGTCTVDSRIDSRNFQLRISQAIEIGALGATQPFDVSTVNLNSLATNGVQGSSGGTNANTNLNSQDTVNQTINEQTPEPEAPAPPAPQPQPNPPAPQP